MLRVVIWFRAVPHLKKAGLGEDCAQHFCSNTIVDISLNACRCPIANFLKERGFYNVEVDPSQITAELTDSSFYLDLEENPPLNLVWVAEFIRNLDRASSLFQERQISVREALAHLENL